MTYRNGLWKFLLVSLIFAACAGNAADPEETDKTSPGLTVFEPSGTLPAGTTSATLAVTTDEAATCKWDLSPTATFANMANVFTSGTDGTEHSVVVSGLADGTSYTYYVQCSDTAGNTSAKSTVISFNVASASDKTPPAISDGQPEGTLPVGTTTAAMSVKTSENATCKWDSDEAASYAAMANTFATTGGTSHQMPLSALTDGQSYTYAVRCRDAAGNASAKSTVINFSVASGVIHGVEPVNPNANSDVRKLLNWLHSLQNRKEKRVISGQYLGWPWRDSFSQIEEIHNKTGKWVGLIHGELLGSNVDDNAQPWDKRIAKLTEWWKKGGLVASSATWYNPKCGISASCGRVDTAPYVDANQVVTPGNKLHENWKQMCDRVAERLDALQKAGVVVIWVPFDESNLVRDQKWWTHENTKILHKWMFNYFTYTKKLNNLIWVYNELGWPGREKIDTDIYPGDQYVDIAGQNKGRGYCDWNEKSYPQFTKWYNDALGRKKLYAYPTGMNFCVKVADSKRCPEHKAVHIIEGIKNFYPRAVYFLAFDSYAGHDLGLQHDYKDPAGLFNHPWIINRDDIDFSAP